ncbi:MAG: MBOAT family O-acyltransferase [Sodaliphilus sp.]
MAFLIVLLPYFTILRRSAKAQNVWLLLGSYAIYGYADWRMLPLLLIVTVGYYFLAPCIAKASQTNPSRANLFTTIGIVAGVGVLFYFKYLNFCIEQFADLFHTIGLGEGLSTLKIIMPVGISFFTFKLLSYTIEVRKGNLTPERDFISFATYVAFFPTIMSGPIDRPQPFLSQLRDARTAQAEHLSEGAKRVLWGFFLKMCIANRICIYTDSVFNHCYFHTGTTLIVASVLYLIQMYADFSGYSHMAIGVSRMMGIQVMENFRQPLFAQNVADFWRKWHISLSSWLRDYIYIPLGGSRCSNMRCYFNNIVTFVICGIWHGANWTYVLFGAWHGVMVVMNRAVKPFRQRLESRYHLPGKALYTLSRQLLTFVLCAFGAMLFRANSFSDILTIVERMCCNFGPLFTSGITLMLTVGLLAFVVMLYKEYRDEYGGKALFMHSPHTITRILSISGTILFILATGELENISFIYFQF